MSCRPVSVCDSQDEEGTVKAWSVYAAMRTNKTRLTSAAVASMGLHLLECISHLLHRAVALGTGVDVKLKADFSFLVLAMLQDVKVCNGININMVSVSKLCDDRKCAHWHGPAGVHEAPVSSLP